ILLFAVPALCILADAFKNAGVHQGVKYENIDQHESPVVADDTHYVADVAGPIQAEDVSGQTPDPAQQEPADQQMQPHEVDFIDVRVTILQKGAITGELEKADRAVNDHDGPLGCNEYIVIAPRRTEYLKVQNEVALDGRGIPMVRKVQINLRGD